MPANQISRRKFLKVAVITLGVSTLACCGLSQLVPSQPTVPVSTPTFSYGKENPMNQRILVAYATHTGSTVGVASAIGETLAGRGFRVDVKPLIEDPDLAQYQSVILGSAVNGGQWLPEAVRYLQNHQQALNQVPVAVFCVHIMNLGKDEKSQKNRQAYLDSVRSLIVPVQEGFFAGKGIDPKTTSPILRWLMRLINIIPEGDCRNWAGINAWAQTVFA
jgi:menaquinone-dependent protoporphyrinogen oxidase